MPGVPELTVSVAVPEPPLMLGGLIVAVRPEVGFGVRLTVPVNPLTGDTVMVAIPFWLTFTIMLVVLVVMVKSVKLNWTVVEWLAEPGLACALTGTM